MKALDDRDIIRSGHSSRVAGLSCAVGEDMRFSESELRDLKLAALSHNDSMQELNAAAGLQFDPRFVTMFCKSFAGEQLYPAARGFETLMQDSSRH